MNLLLANGLLLLPDGQGFAPTRGSLGIDQGMITQIAIGDPPVVPEDCQVIDAHEMLVMPGLLNGHLHGYGCLFRAPLADAPLEVWLPLAQQQRGELDAHTLHVSALLTAAHALLSGTTTILDHVTADAPALRAVAQAYAGAGIRAVIAPQVADLRYLDTLPRYASHADHHAVPAALSAVPARADALAETTADFIEAWHGAGGRITAMVGPSAPQRCSETLLRALADLAHRYQVGIHTHLLETYVQQRTAYDRFGCGMVAHLEDLGLLTPHTSLAHAIWLAADDIARIARCGSSVLYSPASNLLLGSGITPLPLLRAAGIPVGLGTDGMNCSGSLSMFESMKLATALHRSDPTTYPDWISPVEALAMATAGTARALGLGAQVGAIRVGMRADLTLLRCDSLALVPLLDPIGQIVLCERGDGVDTVIVDGKVVVQNRRLLSIDLAALLAEARALADSGRIVRLLPPEEHTQIEYLTAYWYRQQ